FCLRILCLGFSCLDPFLSECCGVQRDLHSFPTRRSSDLKTVELAQIDVQRQIAEQQAIVIGEALKHSKIDIVGGEVEFFDRITRDRKSTRLNSSHVKISYAVFCLKKKTQQTNI